ncbi:MAG: VOC family protein [Actinomycetota bacterium]
MASVSIYLNFPGTTEAAFTFYAEVFGTQFSAPVQRMGDVPPDPNQPALSETDKNLVMHVALPILGGHVIMGTDVVESMGLQLKFGNSWFINLLPDTRSETDRLYAALSAHGTDLMKPQQMFWGDYFGSCQDKFGVRWMFNCAEPV